MVAVGVVVLGSSVTLVGRLVVEGLAWTFVAVLEFEGLALPRGSVAVNIGAVLGTGAAGATGATGAGAVVAASRLLLPSAFNRLHQTDV